MFSLVVSGPGSVGPGQCGLKAIGRGAGADITLQTVGEAGKGPRIGQARDGQVLGQSTRQGSGSGKDREQNIPGAAGGSGWRRGPQFPLRRPSLMCPLANQGRAQSAQDPQGRGRMAFWTPSPSALSTHVEPLGAALFCTHSTKGCDTGAWA